MITAILLTLLPSLPSHVLLLHLPLVGLLVEILVDGGGSMVLLLRPVVLLLFLLVVLLVGRRMLIVGYGILAGRVLLVVVPVVLLVRSPWSKCLSRLCILACLFFVTGLFEAGGTYLVKESH